MTGYFLARMQLHACRFRLGRKKHTEFVLQCSIFNFLTVFGIKITKSPRIPKWKVDISSNFNGIFHQFKLELFIDVLFMENTEMRNKCPRENDLQNQKQIKISTLQSY